MLSGVAASASTLGFVPISQRVDGPAAGFRDGIVVASTGKSVKVFGPKRTGKTVCPTSKSGYCTSDLELIFFGPVNDLKFRLASGGAHRTAIITTYDARGKTTRHKVRTSGKGRVFRLDDGVSRVVMSMPKGGLRLSALSYEPTFKVPKRFPKAKKSARRTVDFRRLPVRGETRRNLKLGNMVVTHADGGRFFVYRGGEYGMHKRGGICAIKAGFTCRADFTVTFRKLVTDLKFRSFFAKKGDKSRLSIWRGSKLLGKVLVSSNGVTDLSRFGPISHILFDDRSRKATAGMAYADFRYAIYSPPAIVAPPVPPPVPLPASGLVLLISLALLGAVSRCRRKVPLP